MTRERLAEVAAQQVRAGIAPEHLPRMFDLYFTTKPDGTPRKLMDSSRLFALGWKPQVALVSEESPSHGLKSTLTVTASPLPPALAAVVSLVAETNRIIVAA